MKGENPKTYRLLTAGTEVLPTRGTVHGARRRHAGGRWRQWHDTVGADRGACLVCSGLVACLLLPRPNETNRFAARFRAPGSESVQFYLCEREGVQTL